MWVQSTPTLNMNQTWTFVMYASNRPSISQLFFEADGHRSSLNAIAWLWLRHYVEPVRNKPITPELLLHDSSKASIDRVENVKSVTYPKEIGKLIIE